MLFHEFRNILVCLLTVTLALIDALLFASERMQDGVGLGKDKNMSLHESHFVTQVAMART